MQNTTNQKQPAYKEFWFWMIMAPLLASVAVCSVLVSLAIVGGDDRVYDDYYKQGRLINNRFEAELAASDRNIRADIEFDFQTGEILLNIEGDVNAGELQLLVSHPLNAQQDQTIALRLVAPGRYRADLDRAFEGRWYVILSSGSGPDTDPLWRIASEIDFNRVHKTTLLPALVAASE